MSSSRHRCLFLLEFRHTCAGGGSFFLPAFYLFISFFHLRLWSFSRKFTCTTGQSKRNQRRPTNCWQTAPDVRPERKLTWAGVLEPRSLYCHIFGQKRPPVCRSALLLCVVSLGEHRWIPHSTGDVTFEILEKSANLHAIETLGIPTLLSFPNWTPLEQTEADVQDPITKFVKDFAVSRRSSHHGRWLSLVIYENPARVLRFEDVDRFKKNVFILSKIFQKQFLKIIAHLYIFSWKVA